MEINEETLGLLSEEIFTSIYDRETILFLGAGASISNKKYLSDEIIDYYSEDKGINLNTRDITEFLDILSADKNFDRDEFDEFIANIIQKYRPSIAHEIIASIPWRQIITTNFDLIIERSFLNVLGTSNENLHLVRVRNFEEYTYQAANDELRYIKLNGCLSDKKRFPLTISSRDFESARKYHKRVINDLQGFSPKIKFLVVGYSFNDIFAKKLLERFGYYNNYKKWIIKVDPNILSEHLSFFNEKKIHCIKTTCENFFLLYKDWYEKNAEVLLGRSKYKFIDQSFNEIRISNSLKARLGENIIQFSSKYIDTNTNPKDFYLGSEPDFSIVKKGVDVIKNKTNTNIKKDIEYMFSIENSLIPILFLTGSYGSGKSTACLRSIYEFTHENSNNTGSFIVVNANRLRVCDLGELFVSTGLKRIILIFDKIEIDSAFKSLITLRNELSIEQFSEFKCILLAPIRENILQKYLTKRTIQNYKEVNIDSKFEETEVTELINKLESSDLVKFRNAKERADLVRNILRTYSGDTLITLLNLLDNSNHLKFIRNAYEQLSEKTKQAFIYTSFFYRFGIYMPAVLLQKLITSEWEEFIEKVIKYDSKGILIQATINSPELDPDLYFYTRHPLISDALVKMFFPTEDQRFTKYREIIRRMTSGKFNSKALIDLLNALRNYDDLSQAQINNLFDNCPREFFDDPHFIIHYAINLQHRHNEDEIIIAIDKIRYVEGLLEKRNHYLIHRRAVLVFELAKIEHNRESELYKTINLINEARELFNIKLLLDPFSHYSYVDLIKMEIWVFEKIELGKQEESKQIILIKNLLLQAYQNVFENRNVLEELEQNFNKLMKEDKFKNDALYLSYLESLYNDETTKPYSLAMQYYYFNELGDTAKVEKLVSELEEHRHLNEISRLLFRHYGKLLHYNLYRKKFQELIENNVSLIKLFPVLYHYYSSISEAYKGHFKLSYEHIQELRQNINHLNPGIKEVWKNEASGEPQIFEGIISVKANKFTKIKILEFMQKFGIERGDYTGVDLRNATRHHVKLYFYLTGIRAEILD